MTARTAVLDKRLPRRAAARVRRLPTDVRHLPAYVTRFPGWVRRTAVALAPSPRVRRRLLVLAGVLALLGASYLFWFRNSSFVKVERVTVTGLSTRDASRLRAALTVTGRSMTTLHVDHDRLVRAVQGFPVVRGLEVRADFPHALRIEVVQHAPAALAIANGLRIPVAGDGTLLRGVPVEGRLPELHVSGSLPADRLRDRKALRLARVAGGAPAALTRRLDEVRESGDRGITVEVREGPTLIFGDATRVRAKWAAAARVLADPSARGASYVDLRLPDRPAAGGVEADTVTPVAPAAGLPAPAPDAAAATTPQASAGPTTTEPGSPTPQQDPAGGLQQTPSGGPQQTSPQAQQPAAQAEQAPPGPAPTAQAGPGGGATANPRP